MAKSKADADRAVAERIARGKDPEKALKRAFPDRPPGEVLWGWLAEGLIQLTRTLGTLAGQTCEAAPVDAIVAAVEHATPHPLRNADLCFCVEQSYRARPEEWEARVDALPHVMQLLLLFPRRRAGKPPLPALRDEAVSLYAQVAVDDAHNHVISLAQQAWALGGDEARFDREVTALLESLPIEQIKGRGHIVSALNVAPWATARRVLATWPTNALFQQVLEKRSDPHGELLAFLQERGLDGDPDYAELLAHRMAAQGAAVADDLDAALIARFAEGRGDAATMALIERFPPERFEAFAAAVRATGTTELCCLGLLRDPARDEAAVAMVWRMIEAGVTADDYRHVLRDLSSPLRDLAAAGAHGYAVLETILEQARTLDERFADTLAFAVYPANVRFQLKRAMFLATAGNAERPIALLLPGEDRLWVERLVDVLGTYGGGWEILADVPEAARAPLAEAWARLDWDGTLSSNDPLSKPHTPPPIEERPWAELAAAIEDTSYPRLYVGERDRATVTRAMARAPSDAERVALVDRVLARVTRWSTPVLRGMMPLVRAVVEVWIAEGRPLEGPRAAMAEALLRAGVTGELQALLLTLPAAQVDGWIAAMAKDPDRAVKKRAKELGPRGAS